jgi:hypothetical protein
VCVQASVLKTGRVGSWRVMAGRRVLSGWVNGFSRDGLGRVHFGGLGRDPSGRERDGSAGQICFLKFRKIQKSLQWFSKSLQWFMKRYNVSAQLIQRLLFFLNRYNDSQTAITVQALIWLKINWNKILNEII